MYINKSSLNVDSYHTCIVNGPMPVAQQAYGSPFDFILHSVAVWFSSSTQYSTVHMNTPPLRLVYSGTAFFLSLLFFQNSVMIKFSDLFALEAYIINVDWNGFTEWNFNMYLLLGILAGSTKDCPSAASRKCYKSGKTTLCNFYFNYLRIQLMLERLFN